MLKKGHMYRVVVVLCELLKLRGLLFGLVSENTQWEQSNN